MSTESLWYLAALVLAVLLGLRMFLTYRIATRLQLLDPDQWAAVFADYSPLSGRPGPSFRVKRYVWSRSHRETNDAVLTALIFADRASLVVSVLLVGLAVVANLLESGHVG